MKANELLQFLTELQELGNDLSTISINYRYDNDSDVEVCNFVEEDLFDEETNKTLTSIILLTDNSDK